MPGWTMKALIRTHAASARQPSAACTGQSDFKRVLKGSPAPWLHLLILPGRNEGAELSCGCRSCIIVGCTVDTLSLMDAHDPHMPASETITLMLQGMEAPLSMRSPGVRRNSSTHVQSSNSIYTILVHKLRMLKHRSPIRTWKADAGGSAQRSQPQANACPAATPPRWPRKETPGMSSCQTTSSTHG